MDNNERIRKLIETLTHLITQMNSQDEGINIGEELEIARVKLEALNY